MKKEVLKKTLFILLISIISINLSAFVTIKQGEKDEIRDLPSFNKLSLKISADVYLKQSSKQEVKIEASERLLNLIETKVENGILKIKWKKSKVLSHKEKIKIYISMKDIKALIISGSGDIMAKSKIKTDKLSLEISGSGDILIGRLNAKEVSAVISGSADIVIREGAELDKLKVVISGSGDVEASGIMAKDASVTISGSGSCNLHTSEKLYAKIAGSGDIVYTGDALIDAKIAGSGSVKHKN